MEHSLTPAKQGLLELIKTRGPSKAQELADELALTVVAVRQHLTALKESGLVTETTLPARGRGRPSSLWELTEAAGKLFPDTHGDLANSLLDAIAATYGSEAIEEVLAARTNRQVTLYRRKLNSSKGLKARVMTLARQRTREGYMAEVITEKPGVFLLIEHHCAIRQAATKCAGFCGSELEVFRRALGKSTSVERTEHLLAGDRRCAYRIQKKRS